MADDDVLHRCEDGHNWTRHSDGTVSPSWGGAGTHLPVDDPHRCPEPERTDAGAYRCPTCQRAVHHGRCPEGHKPPPPACLKAATFTRAWADADHPFDGGRGLYLLRHGHSPDRLVIVRSSVSRWWVSRWSVTCLRTGEDLEVDGADAQWSARRVGADALPQVLRERWPTHNGKPVLADAETGPRPPDSAWIRARIAASGPDELEPPQLSLLG